MIIFSGSLGYHSEEVLTEKKPNFYFLSIYDRDSLWSLLPVEYTLIKKITAILG